MFFFLLKLVVALAIFFVGFGVWRSWQMEHSDKQNLFVAGTAPSPALDGLYAGRVPGQTFSWKGKKFDALHATGINVFRGDNDATYEKYSFVTTTDRGVRTNTTVLKIDYNISENPFWLRPVLDEVVQVAPNSYLGKLQLRVVPGYPFTLGFFELAKEN